MSSTSTPARLAALQFEPQFGDLERNLERIEQLSSGRQADVLVLPELCTTGYSFRDRAEVKSLAEPYPDGPGLRRLRALSGQTGALLVAGYAERDGDRLYNSAALFAAGEALGTYRKIHLFGFEREVFDPGDRGFFVVRHRDIAVGTMVCFDWIFPEACRTLALRGAEVIAHPSNLVLPGWCQQAMRVRGLENRVFTITANRHGVEERAPRPLLRFTGESQITDPQGKALVTASAAQDTYIQMNVDVALARQKVLASGNDVFAERRPDTYE